MTAMLKSLADKTDNRHDHRKDISRHIESTRRDQIEMLEMKTMVKD